MPPSAPCRAGLKAAVVEAATATLSPVRGLRAVRAGLRLAANVPKPMRLTASFRASAPEMQDSMALTGPPRPSGPGQPGLAGHMPDDVGFVHGLASRRLPTTTALPPEPRVKRPIRDIPRVARNFAVPRRRRSSSNAGSGRCRGTCYGTAATGAPRPARRHLVSAYRRPAAAQPSIPMERRRTVRMGDTAEGRSRDGVSKSLTRG